MMNFTSYIINSTGCLFISYILYRLLLKNETMFLQQRLFLISSIIMSLVFPLIKISFALPDKHVSVEMFTVKQISSHITESIPDSDLFQTFGSIMAYIYIIVSTLLIMSVLVQSIRIWRIFKTSEKINHDGFLVLRNKKVKNPFSFFGWIFIPWTLKDPDEIRSIIIHEKIHVRQFHSFDNLILEFTCALMWFNPIIWMMKKSLHLIHEYMADEGTLNSGIDKIRYHALLLNQAAEEKLIYIPSGFNNNLLKKRIMMMTKTKSNDPYRVKILSFIPLPLILLLTVALLNGLFPAQLKAQGIETSKNKEITVTGYGQNGKSDVKNQTDTINYIVDGVRVSSIDNINPDSIESVNVLKEDRTIIIRTKNFATNQHLSIRAVNGTKDNVIYILDGKKITKAELDIVDPNSIESINVRRDETMKKKYGADDYDGVIIIKTKK